jgi:DmsE family decaheme c-type cytochrome
MSATLTVVQRLFHPLVLLATLLLAGPAAAQSYPGIDELPGYSARGADTCLACHDWDPKVMSIFETAHGAYNDPRSPMANLQCEACHGPGGAHTARVRRGETQPPMPAFAKDSPMPRHEASQVCMGCHSAIGSTHAEWAGSTHQRNDVACVDCHKVHSVHDPVRERADQAQVCYQCHTDVRAQAARPFAHPVREGLVACSDCHQPHGSMTDAMLVRPTLNETCYSCHAEKRGPVLWEHPPVAESCANCHVPHGSMHPGMLSRRAPLLCQSCHSRAGHPSIAQTGEGLPGGVPSSMLLAGSCLNCHAQVHGSNHPSGANLSR